MKTDIELLNEVADLLNESLSITKVIHFQSIKTLLETNLDTKEKRLVYELSDGEKTVREIANLADVNISSISTWSQYWEQIGILTAVRGSDVKGRRKKLFTLASYGIKLENS